MPKEKTPKQAFLEHVATQGPLGDSTGDVEYYELDAPIVHALVADLNNSQKDPSQHIGMHILVGANKVTCGKCPFLYQGDYGGSPQWNCRIFEGFLGYVGAMKTPNRLAICTQLVKRKR